MANIRPCMFFKAHVAWTNETWGVRLCIGLGYTVLYSCTVTGSLSCTPHLIGTVLWGLVYQKICNALGITPSTIEPEFARGAIFWLHFLWRRGRLLNLTCTILEYSTSRSSCQKRGCSASQLSYYVPIQQY